MPIEVEGPDGAVIEFPDNTDPATIRRVMAQRYNAKAKPKPAAPRSTARQFGDATVNALAGLAQGAAAIPDVVTDAVGGTLRLAGRPVTSGLSALAEAAGADGLAQGIRRTGAQWERAMARPATIGGMIERAAPTPKDTAGKTVRIASQLVGGALVPAGPKVTPPARLPKPTTPNPAREIVQEGNRAGIRVMTSDVRPPRTFMGRAAQAGGERVPVLGTGGVRETQQGQRVAAVQNILRDHGLDDAANLADDVAADLVKTRGSMITRMKGAKDTVIDGIQGTVPVPQATKAIDDQIARLKALKSAEYTPVIAKLEDWKQSIQGQGLRNIEDLRALMGTAFDDPGLAGVKSTGQKAVNAIYGPLRADMGNFIKAQGGQSAFAKWKGANEKLAAMAGELNVRSFKSTLSNAETTPEVVGKLLFSKNPSDVRRLYSNLSPDGRLKAQAAVLQRAMEKAGGFDNISPDRFAGEIQRLGKNVGIIFQDGDLARINGLTRVLEATKRAAQANVMTNSGQQAVPFLIGGAAVAQPAFVATGAIAARVYESPAVRDLLLKLGKTAPGSAAEARLLPRVIMAVNTQVERFAPAMNDNVAAPLAASDGEGDIQGDEQ